MTRQVSLGPACLALALARSTKAVTVILPFAQLCGSHCQQPREGHHRRGMRGQDHPSVPWPPEPRR